MRKTCLLLCLLTLSVSTIYGQKLTGVVVDSELMTPLEAANITIFGLDSIIHASKTSDADGNFEVEVALDSYFVGVSCVGYVDYTLRVQGGKNLNMGKISLHKSEHQIDDIVVTAVPIIIALDKTIAYPTDAQVRASSNGIELLKNLYLPGMFVDLISRSVTVSGASQVIYKINGIPASQQKILALKPGSILRIEYGDTPTARYADSNAATIDIILKERDTGTYLFADFTSALTTGFINGSGSASTVFGSSELAIDYSVNWRDYDKRWGYETETYNLPTESYSWIKDWNSAPFGYTNHDIDVAYTFDRKKNVFSVKLYNNIFTSYSNSDIDIQRVGVDLDNLNRDVYSENKRYTPSLDLFYKRKFSDKSSLEFNAVGTYMNSDYFRNLTDTYVNQPGKESLLHNVTAGNKKSAIFEALYSKIGSKVNYSFGVRGSYSYTKNTYDDTNTSRLEQMVLYPYASLSGRVKKFAYSIGTGVNFYRMDNYGQSKTYVRNLSSLNLQYSFNDKWSLRNFTAYRPSYPSLGDLSDITQRRDTLTVVRGNPNITPSQTLSNYLRLAFTHKRIMVYGAVYASKTFDAINDEIFYDDTFSSVVIQKRNQTYNSSFGGSLEVVVPSILDMFTVTLGAYLNRYESKGVGYKYSMNHFHWLAMLDFQYKNLTVSAGYMKPQIGMYGRYKTQDENYSAVHISYKVKDLTFKAGVYYPLTSGTKYSSTRMSDVAPSHVLTYIKDNANMVIVGVTYNINWGKSPFQIRKKLQNTDTDSGILSP